MKSNVSRPFARRAFCVAASLFYLGAAMAVPGAKISPVITGLADGRILAAWASHIPESGKAWRTDWKWFDERGEILGQGFDWVSYPGRVMKTVPDLAVSLNTSRPMTRGKPGTNAFIALAGSHPNAATEIELPDSDMAVVKRRTFPGGPGQELALTRTASGLIALLNLQAPYQSTSPYGLLLMDPRWE